jgi:hypothetical protein
LIIIPLRTSRFSVSYVYISSVCGGNFKNYSEKKKTLHLRQVFEHAMNKKMQYKLQISFYSLIFDPHKHIHYDDHKFSYIFRSRIKEKSTINIKIKTYLQFVLHFLVHSMFKYLFLPKTYIICDIRCYWNKMCTRGPRCCGAMVWVQ